MVQCMHVVQCMYACGPVHASCITHVLMLYTLVHTCMWAEINLQRWTLSLSKSQVVQEW